MAAKIVHGPAARLGDIPKMRAMRAAMRLPRTDPEHSTDSALLDRLPCFDDTRREHLRFRIAVQRARLLGSLKHRLGLIASAAQRLGANLIFSRSRQGKRYREVCFVGQRDDEEIDIAAFDQLLELRGIFGNRPSIGE